MRRFFDCGSSVIGLLLLSPLFVVITFAIKLQDAGPVFYLARRIGQNGKEFRLLKFRTMAVNADREGPGITSSGDQRVTPVGRFLRRYKLDEFPQLINVARGEMALVGPRPEDPRYIESYDQNQRRILSIRPGITSPASLSFKEEHSLLTGSDWVSTYLADVAPRKIEIDLDYFEHNTFWSDLAVILRTIRCIAP